MSIALQSNQVFAMRIEAMRAQCFWWYPASTDLMTLGRDELCRCLRLHGGHQGWLLADELCRLPLFNEKF